MTSKEALEYLEDIYEHEEGELTPYDDPIGKKIAYKEEFDILRKLVDRDTPKKVEIGTSKQFKFPICPNCKVELNEYYKYANKFCKECGQRIMWEKENEK